MEGGRWIELEHCGETHRGAARPGRLAEQNGKCSVGNALILLGDGVQGAGELLAELKKAEMGCEEFGARTAGAGVVADTKPRSFGLRVV